MAAALTVLGRLLSRRHRLAAGVVASAALIAAMAHMPVAEAASTFNAHLTRAPYLTDLVGLHVNVNWATDQSATTGSLQWGPVTGGTCTLPNTMTATRNAASITVGTVKEYQWKAALTLPAQGTYCYRPLLAGTDLLAANPSPQFTTQAAAGDSSPFAFDVMGDWGMVDSNGNNPDQARLDAQIAASGARFTVAAGDNGYNSGSQLNYGDLQQTGDSTSAIFGPSFWTVAGSSIPLFTAVGNHGLSGTSHTDITTWTQDQAVSSSGGTYANGTYSCCTGSTVNYGNEWYAFNAGPARFYILDSAWGDSNGGTSTPYGQDYANHFSPGDPEYQWLLADLQAHPGVMKFAFMHYPWYSANSSQTSDTFMTTAQPGAASSIEKLFADNDVKIVFNGHAHIYQRNNPSAPGMPITYITGGGGATLEPVTLCGGNAAYARGWSPTKLKGYACGAGVQPPASASQVFHFLKVTVAGSSVTVAPTDENGNTFDVQTYNFTTGVDTVIDTAPDPLTNATSATFTFHASATGATYACSLDAAAATPCTSPASYSGLAEGTHTFSVAATVNGTTDPTPATDTWTVDTTPPSAPSGLTATAAGPTTVNLSWNASTDSNGVTGYDIVRNGTTIGTVSGTTTSYVDASASPATSYTYTVDARDGAGNVSQPSAPATVTTPSGTASPALVQAAGSTTGTVTLPRPSTQGDLLVLSASVYTGATNHITSVTDSAGNSWTRIGAYDVSGHNSDGEMWYSPNAASATTVTVHLSSTVNTAIEVQEFSGVATASPLDTSAGQSNTSTSADSSSITAAAGNELLVGFAAGHANAETMTVSSAGFTTQSQQTTGASVASIVTGSKVLSTPSAQAFTATFPTAMYWAAGIAAFKAAG
jgi:fibronectin type III domain protein/calcineurin-like phosphoesterase family protein